MLWCSRSFYDCWIWWRDFTSGVRLSSHKTTNLRNMCESTTHQQLRRPSCRRAHIRWSSTCRLGHSLRRCYTYPRIFLQCARRDGDKTSAPEELQEDIRRCCYARLHWCTAVRITVLLYMVQMPMLVKGHFHNAARIRNCLTTVACKTTVHALVVSRGENNNGLLYGLHETQLHKLHIIQNSAARHITGTPWRDHKLSTLQILTARFRWEGYDSSQRCELSRMYMRRNCSGSREWSTVSKATFQQHQYALSSDYPVNE